MKILIAVLLASAVAGRAQTNTITFTMPAAGYATIAINNADGVRVRNLLGSVRYEAGPHTAEWDGRDDKGELLPPGEYRWVSWHRDHLHAVYRGSFVPRNR